MESGIESTFESTTALKTSSKKLSCGLLEKSWQTFEYDPHILPFIFWTEPFGDQK